MHAYATDSMERAHILFCIAALSIIAAYGLHRIFFALNFIAPWWLEVPSPLGFYGIFYTAFDRWLWKWILFRKIGLVKVPELNGAWNGSLTSSFHEHSQQLKAEIRISQTWTQIRIVLETEASKSNSKIAAILTEDPDCIELSYEYLNEPRAKADKGMQTHRGTAHFIFRKTKDSESLKGEYYSGRDRQNYGTLEFKRVCQK